MSLRQSLQVSQSMTIPPKALEVTIICARGLMNADVIGLSDPYTLIEIKGKPDVKHKTKVIDNNLNPVWNEQFKILNFDIGDVLELSVWDKDMWPKKDDLLGRLSLRSDQILPKGFDGVELPLVETEDHESYITLNIRPIY